MDERQSPKIDSLESVARALDEQAEVLQRMVGVNDGKDLAEESRAERIKRRSRNGPEQKALEQEEEERLERHRDLELLREQVEDLAGQVWTLQRRHPALTAPRRPEENRTDEPASAESASSEQAGSAAQRGRQQT